MNIHKLEKYRQIKDVATALAVTFGLTVGPAVAVEQMPLAPLPELEQQDADQVALGKLLFFDNRISGNADRSCSDCHVPKKGWADGISLSTGYPGTEYFRNAKTIINAVHSRFFYWDARLDGTNMPTQVRDTITESHFMAGDGRIMHQRLKNVPEYVHLFEKAFGGEPSFNRILKAISSFERTLVSRNVPFDKYLVGDDGAISESAKRGLKLFKGKADCVRCHNGAMLTDSRTHNLGVPDNSRIVTDIKRHVTMRSMMSFLGVPNYHNLRQDPGFFAVSKDYNDFGSFLTPSLREVSRTAPYMHNGMLPTLASVVDFYDSGGGAEGKGNQLEPLGLSDGEKSDLVEFLKSLSGDEIIIDIPKGMLPKYQPISDWYQTVN